MFTCAIDKDVFTTEEMRKSAECLISKLNAIDVDDGGNGLRYHILSTLNEINMLSMTLKNHKVGVNSILIRAAALKNHIKNHGGTITDYAKIKHNNIILYSKEL